MLNNIVIIVNNISDNLRKLRGKKSYSVEKITLIAGLSFNAFVKIENGVNQNLTIKTPTKITKTLRLALMIK